MLCSNILRLDSIHFVENKIGILFFEQIPFCLCLWTFIVITDCNYFLLGTYHRDIELIEIFKLVNFPIFVLNVTKYIVILFKCVSYMHALFPPLISVWHCFFENALVVKLEKGLWALVCIFFNDLRVSIAVDLVELHAKEFMFHKLPIILCLLLYIMETYADCKSACSFNYFFKVIDSFNLRNW